MLSQANLRVFVFWISLVRNEIFINDCPSHLHGLNVNIFCYPNKKGRGQHSLLGHQRALTMPSLTPKHLFMSFVGKKLSASLELGSGVGVFMNLAFLELGLPEFSNYFSSVVISTPQSCTVCDLWGWEYLSLAHVIMVLHVTSSQLICIPQDHNKTILGYSRKQIWEISRVSNNTMGKRQTFIFICKCSFCQ